MYAISQKSFALLLNFLNYSQLLFSQIPAMHTLMLREDIGLEMKLWAFSIRRAMGNDLSA